MSNNSNKNNSKNSSSKNIKITPEALKNGDVLCALIVRFLKKRSKENMMSVLSCLRDSNVFMPAEVAVGGGKELIPTQILYPAVQNIVIKPQLMKAGDGKNYLPLFSREINAKAGQLKNFQLVNLPYFKCIDMLEGIEGCDRFVIDPFLYNFVLTEDLIDISKQLPSRLDSKK